MEQSPWLPPLVSVIIPCYNGAKWLHRSVESSLEQSYGNVEVIVVDDGSTDGTAEVASGYGPRVVVSSGGHRGACAARNRGAAIARGNYIQFVDSDDQLLPDKIERHVPVLEDTGADGVFGDYYLYDRVGKAEYPGVKVVVPAPADLLVSVIGGWFVHLNSLLLRRSAFVASGGFDESLEFFNDVPFLLNVAVARLDLRRIDGATSVVWTRGGSLSDVGPKSATAAFLRNIRYSDRLLAENGLLEGAIRTALAQKYLRAAARVGPSDKQLFDECVRRALALDASVCPDRPALFRAACKLFGFRQGYRAVGRPLQVTLALRRRAEAPVVRWRRRRRLISRGYVVGPDGRPVD